MSSDPIQTLRPFVGDALITMPDVVRYSNGDDEYAALTQVENLVRAARFAAPCVDRNATLATQTLADALAPFKDTP